MEKDLIEFTKNITSSNPLLAYIFFFFNAALQILFPPYPGDTVTVLQGYLSSKGFLNTYFLLTSTLLGTYLSSIFLYWISYIFGEKLIVKNYIEKYFDFKKIYKLENWFKRYGCFAIIINKFIPGVGSLTLIAAGLFQVPPVSAFISIGIAVVIHNIFLFMAGRFTGDNIELIKHMIAEYNRIILIALAVTAVIYSYTKFIYKIKSNKKNQ